MVQTTGGLTDFSEETLGKISGSYPRVHITLPSSSEVCPGRPVATVIPMPPPQTPSIESSTVESTTGETT